MSIRFGLSLFIYLWPLFMREVAHSRGLLFMHSPPVSADAQGDAMTITTLNIHTLTTTHEAGTMVALKTPQGFNSIACGDVKTREATRAVPV